MRPEIWWIIAAAILILAVVYRLLGWRYLPPLDLPGPAGAPVTAASESSGGVMPTAGIDESLYPLEMAWAAVGRAGESQDSDDEWVTELHEINQLGKFGDLTRPVAHQTHYEVEYLIRQLGVAEWVPERWRVAA